MRSESRSAALLEFFQKMDGTIVVPLLPQGLGQEREAHRIMGVRDRKPLWFPEQSSSGRKEGLAENHGRHGQRSQQWLPIIKSLRASSQIARKEALVVVGSLAVAVEPAYKAVDG